jgi:hypothetical protein
MGPRPTEPPEDSAGRSLGISNVFNGVPYGPRRPTNGNEDAAGTGRALSPVIRRVFRGVPMGPRPTKAPEDAAGRSRGTGSLDRVFRGALAGD